MNDGKGSPIIVLPILVLLLCAGAAALAGIALQPSSSSTPTAAPITESDFGAACATPPGPRPSDPAALPTWLAAVRTCVDAELTNLPGYAGAGIEGFANDVVVVHWRGQAPAIVVRHVKVIAPDATVVGTQS